MLLPYIIVYKLVFFLQILLSELVLCLYKGQWIWGSGLGQCEDDFVQSPEQSFKHQHIQTQFCNSVGDGEAKYIFQIVL